ncbi:MAG: flavoprotein, partial [Pseudonocardia sp.]
MTPPSSGTLSRARPRLVVGITGASAPHLGIHLLRALRRLGTVETHLVISQAAHRTIELETGMRPADVAPPGFSQPLR